LAETGTLEWNPEKQIGEGLLLCSPVKLELIKEKDLDRNVNVPVLPCAKYIGRIKNHIIISKRVLE